MPSVREQLKKVIVTKDADGNVELLPSEIAVLRRCRVLFETWGYDTYRERADEIDYELSLSDSAARAYLSNYTDVLFRTQAQVVLQGSKHVYYTDGLAKLKMAAAYAPSDAERVAATNMLAAFAKEPGVSAALCEVSKCRLDAHGTTTGFAAIVCATNALVRRLCGNHDEARGLAEAYARTIETGLDQFESEEEEEEEA